MLLDASIEWDRALIFVPRLNYVPVGWLSFNFNDRTAMAPLNLPVVDQGEDLYLLATGSYTINRGQVALTAAREFELKELRRSGGTGSLDEYNRLASEIPRDTVVLYTYQNNRPRGYSESLFGQWLGPLLVLKCQLPSSHKAATRTNLHNITLVISRVSVPNNPLGLEGTLSRLIAYHCSCKSGAGTNRACAHVMGLVIGLLGPQFFKSAKKNTGLMTDISLPIQQQPVSTGKIR